MTDLPPVFGVDLLTFFSPRFWGLDSMTRFGPEVADRPLHFWRTVLDGLDRAGVTEFEMTFAPADRSTAVAAYGSAEGFAEEVQRRGFRVVSSYFGALEKAENLHDPAVQQQILDFAEEDAQFLATIGARFLVAGLPMRTNRVDGRGFEPVDLALAAPIADLLNRIGAVTAAHGITLALHPESHSVFWTPRDIDLFLLLTDPFVVAFCPDTGHIVLGGGDPLAVVQSHRDRVVLAHWKDAIGAFKEDVVIDSNVFEAHQPYFRPAGQGVIDWSAWGALLRSFAFDGGVLLELDAADDPVQQLIDARTYLEGVLQDLHSMPDTSHIQTARRTP